MKVLIQTGKFTILGKSVMSTCIGYIFEKSFLHVNPQSMLYLRNKLSSELSLSKFFRQLDPVNTNGINDETAVISLYILLGAMVKDFGFEELFSPSVRFCMHQCCKNIH